MHGFDVGVLFLVLTLVGVEFSVSAFINPAARRLEPAPQLQFLSRTAAVFGTVMPVWYPLCALLLGVETWLHWHETGVRLPMLAADAIWVLVSLVSLVFLVPLNTRIARGAADWQGIHRVWDRRHQVRIGALAVAGLLLTWALVR